MIAGFPAASPTRTGALIVPRLQGDSPAPTRRFRRECDQSTSATGSSAGASSADAASSASAFVDNRATMAGGAIWADGDALYEIENTLFSGTQTDGDLGFGAVDHHLAGDMTRQPHLVRTALPDR